jgi:hypothetical protein
MRPGVVSGPWPFSLHFAGQQGRDTRAACSPAARAANHHKHVRTDRPASGRPPRGIVAIELLARHPQWAYKVSKVTIWTLRQSCWQSYWYQVPWLVLFIVHQLKEGR